MILRVVTPETEEHWVEKGKLLTVRRLEAEAAETRARLKESQPDGAAAVEQAEEERPRVRVVMAPPGVAVRVAEAVEVARKLEGYHIGAGQAVSMMAMELMAGIPQWPDTPQEYEPGSAAPQEEHAGSAKGSGGSLLEDHDALRRELGRNWQQLHEQMERLTSLWADLPPDLPEVVLHGAPPEDADAHQRVVFWSAFQGRLDAVRGRLLRLIDERLLTACLGFACLGQYARERMGLSLREAQELICLDRALSKLPAAFRMYASGRLGKKAAWLITKVATGRTERAWTRFALTHTLRLLEAAVDAALLTREADPVEFARTGGMPPSCASFADTVRACSLPKPEADQPVQPTARIRLVFDAEQEACYLQAVTILRALYGEDRPEWWCLAVMAQHFLNCYAEADKEALPARLRRTIARKVLERDNYTCGAPECLKRGHLEADHIDLASRGGPTIMSNLHALCVAHHRHLKHQAGTLAVFGRAPDDLTFRMGQRLYRKDRLVRPELREEELDEDPWEVSEPAAAHGL